MDGIVFIGLHRALFIHGIARDVEDAAHHAFADRHGNRFAGIDHLVAAAEAFGAGHGNGANPVVAQMLLCFESELRRGTPGRREFDGERIKERRQCVAEFHVHHGTDNLNDFSFIHGRKFYCPIAMAALVISKSSRVMLAWRSLLYSSVRSLMSCLALSVAFFIATMRELCSEALASSR